MKYEEIIQDIKVKIIQGYWKSDDKLPSLRQLARKYKTSSNTIAFAFRILRDEGYIFSIPAVGYFIKKRNDFQISKQVKTILKSYYDTENKNDNLINFTSTDLLSKYINNNFISHLFEIQKKIFNQNEAKIISRGWVFHSSGTLKIVGIGYFKDMSRISEQNSLSFLVERGRYRLEILGGYRGANFNGSPAPLGDTPILSDTPVFHLRLTPSAEPKFSGDLETPFYF